MTPLDALLNEVPLAPLDRGLPDGAMRPRIEAACAGLPPACRAGLWLAFGFLDESHSISQDLATPEGSLWHAMMHRREGDYWNSKYWLRQAGTHPVFGQLGDAAAKLGWDAWDAPAFVDLCEKAVREGGTLEAACREAQAAEWRTLFAWCRERG